MDEKGSNGKDLDHHADIVNKPLSFLIPKHMGVPKL
jgi:hypothetical protein